MKTPLYETEFGHGLSLHDGEIEEIEETPTGSSNHLWTIYLFQSWANSGRNERGYRYKLMFAGCDLIDRINLIGQEIYDFEVSQMHDRIQVSIQLTASGQTLEFNCRCIEEVSLEQVDKTT